MCRLKSGGWSLKAVSSKILKLFSIGHRWKVWDNQKWNKIFKSVSNSIISRSKCYIPELMSVYPAVAARCVPHNF